MPVENPKKPLAQPGDGIGSMRTTSVFKLINFELYTKPNKIIMGLGLVCAASVFGYIAYMRHKYEQMGYYVAIQNDGTEVFKKKKSNWDT